MFIVFFLLTDDTRDRVTLTFLVAQLLTVCVKGKI
jgi:hypothetical protein